MAAGQRAGERRAGVAVAILRRTLEEQPRVFAEECGAGGEEGAGPLAFAVVIANEHAVADGEEIDSSEAMLDLHEWHGAAVAADAQGDDRVAVRDFQLGVAAVLGFDPNQGMWHRRHPTHGARAGRHAFDRHLVLQRQLGNGRDHVPFRIPDFDIARERREGMQVRERCRELRHEEVVAARRGVGTRDDRGLADGCDRSGEVHDRQLRGAVVGEERFVVGVLEHVREGADRCGLAFGLLDDRAAWSKRRDGSRAPLLGDELNQKRGVVRHPLEVAADGVVHRHVRYLDQLAVGGVRDPQADALLRRDGNGEVLAVVGPRWEAELAGR